MKIEVVGKNHHSRLIINYLSLLMCSNRGVPLIKEVCILLLKDSQPELLNRFKKNDSLRASEAFILPCGSTLYEK